MDTIYIEILRQLGVIVVAVITAWSMIRTKAGDAKQNPVAPLINANAAEDAKEVARLNRELGRAEVSIRELKRDLRAAQSEIDTLRDEVRMLRNR